MMGEIISSEDKFEIENSGNADLAEVSKSLILDARNTEKFESKMSLPIAEL